MSSQSLRSRILQASIWTFFGFAMSQVLRLFSGVVTSRLLSPEIFGLMSILTVIFVGIALLTDVGLTQHVIKSNQTDKPEYINTVWTMQVIKGFLIWLISIIVSICLYFAIKNNLMPVSSGYSNPLLPFLLPALTFTAVLSGLEPTWVMLATKNLAQKKLIKLELITQIFSAFIVITWAYFNQSIWAIIAGQLGASILRLILVYWKRPLPYNKFYFDKKFAKEILHFGKWIFLSTLISFYAVNGDRLILGGLLQEKVMGFYAIAYMFNSLLVSIYEKFISVIAYSALAESFEDSKDKFRNVYQKFRVLTDAPALFISGVFFSAGFLIIQIIYDDRYIEAGWILQILPLGLITLRYRMLEYCFMVLDKSHIMTLCTTVRAISIIILIPFLYQTFGLVGAIWAIPLSTLSSLPIFIFYAHKNKLLNIKNEFLVLPALLAGYLFGLLIVKLYNIIIHIDY